MKIELEEPFRSKWKSGYVLECKKKRKRVYLANSKADRTTISYARYLMSIKLGRFLNEDEHVDHIDEDRTNDDIENLQILTQKENNKKYKDTIVTKPKVEYTCPVCNAAFKVRHGNSHLVDSKKFQLKTCSHSCSGKKIILNLSKEERFLINEQSIIR